jgi:hypothetical protein
MPDATSIFTKRDPATGAVLFDFSGHVHAAGLDLDVADSGSDAPADHQVRWMRTATQPQPGKQGGRVNTIVTSADGVDFNELDAIAFTPDGTAGTGGLVSTGVAKRLGSGALGGMLSYLSMLNRPGLATRKRNISAIVRNDADNADVSQIVTNSAGESTFLQLTGLGRARVSWGPAAAFFNAARQSTTQVVGHGLGVVPVLVLVQNVYADGGNIITFVRQDPGLQPTANNFWFFGDDQYGTLHGPGSLTFNWLAIALG